MGCKLEPDPMRETRRRRRRLRRRRYHEDVIPRVDPVAVKARLSASMARWTVPGICLFLVAAVALVYGQVLDHHFIDLGDKTTVYGNPLVTSVTSGLRPSVIRQIFRHVDHDTCGFYTPLTMISHMVDWRLYNQLDDKSASGHHLMNVLLHGATAILLFLTLRLITGAIWRSAFTAALFAIHPLQVESVAWVAERGNVLCGLFFILAIGAYVRYVYRPWSLMRYFVVLALFIAGLLSQPAMVALPFVLLLLDYWPLSRYTRPVFSNKDGAYRRNFAIVFFRLLTEKIPFFAISLLAYLATLHAQKKIDSSLDTLSLPSKINNALVSCFTYIGRTFYPRSLTVFYPKFAEPRHLFEMRFAFIMLAFISMVAFVLRKKRPYLIVGWFWFLGMLAPAIGWGEGGVFAGADRYSYLPLIGLYFIIAWGSWDLCVLLPRRTWIAAGAVSIAMVALIARARSQCAYWQDGISLWTHALDVTSDNYIAHDNLARTLVEEKGSMDDAIAHYGKALAIRPNYAEAHGDLAIALLQKGKLDDAIIQYQYALEIRPNYAETNMDMGEALVEKGNLDEAMFFYRRAVSIRPGYADAHYNLGVAYTQKGDLPDAITQFKVTLQIRPYYAEAHFNLGFALTQTGDLQEAISHYASALEIRPNYAEACYYLGFALYKNGNLDAAMSNWEKAIALKPNYEEAHYNLGLALVQKGKLDEAIAQYQKALEIGPNYAEIYNNIGTALLMKKDFPGAIANYEKAVEIKPDYLLARNDLAWLLATCPIASLRDGKQAVELIQNESRLAGDKDPVLLRTLAAALAESGRFPEAVDFARRALQGLDANKNPDISAGLQREIKLYEAGSTFHDIQ